MIAARWEIAFVVLTGLGNFLVAEWMGLRLAFVVGACILWILFVAARATADPSVLERWGFTTRDLGRSAALLLPAAAVALAGFAAIGLLTGRLVLHWHIALIALLYPVWGLIQQFLVVALLAGNLRAHSRIAPRRIVLLTASVFAAAHLPSLPLAAAAFLLAGVTTMVYFHARNLWALGLFHGWFATGLYYFALGQDPWREVIAGRVWP